MEYKHVITFNEVLEILFWFVETVWKHLVVYPYKTVFRKFKYSVRDRWSTKFGVWTWASILVTFISYYLAYEWLHELAIHWKYFIFILGYSIGIFFSLHYVNFRLDDSPFVLHQYYIFKQVVFGTIAGMIIPKFLFLPILLIGIGIYTILFGIHLYKWLNRYRY